MKAKTKDQLRNEILALEAERDTLKQELEDVKRLYDYTRVAFLFTMQHAYLLAKKYIGKYSVHEALADIVITYFAELTRLTDLDFTQGRGLEHVGESCDDMGFDQVTTTVIKQRVPQVLQINKMAYEGKGIEEIVKYVDKIREGEGRGRYRKQ